MALFFFSRHVYMCIALWSYTRTENVIRAYMQLCTVVHVDTYYNLCYIAGRTSHIHAVESLDSCLALVLCSSDHMTRDGRLALDPAGLVGQR